MVVSIIWELSGIDYLGRDNVSPFGMDGIMVQAHHAVDLVKYFWFLVLTLRGLILYIIVIEA